MAIKKTPGPKKSIRTIPHPAQTHEAHVNIKRDPVETREAHADSVPPSVPPSPSVSSSASNPPDVKAKVAHVAETMESINSPTRTATRTTERSPAHHQNPKSKR